MCMLPDGYGRQPRNKLSKLWISYRILDKKIMSSFKTHRRFNYLMFIIGCLILVHFNLFNIYVMITIGIGFIIGTELITPDLDTESIPSHRAGWLWFPYRLVFKHRGKSHSYIWGFISRILYIILLAAVVCLIFSIHPVLTPEFMAIALVIIVGIAIANGLHIVLDKVT